MLERFGEFEVVAPLSRGGMGEVLLAEQQGAGGFKRLVALKVMRVDLETDHNARNLFFDEAQLLGRINHPAVAQIIGFGEAEGTLYLAMEFIAGVSLASLRKSGPVEPAIAAALVAAAARGLHAAHELKDLQGHPLNVVHRDVSPHNLMVTFEGQVKVLDFGIALHRERTSQATEFGSIRGKAAYISPEALMGKPATRGADIWALGVVLHELLTGKPLFAREQDLAAMHAVLNDPIPSAGSPALAHLLELALERDPERRFQTAEAFAEALEAIAYGTSLEQWARSALATRRAGAEAWLRQSLDSRRVRAPAAFPSASPQGRESATESISLEVTAPPLPVRRWRVGAAVTALFMAATVGIVALVTTRPGATGQPETLPPRVELAVVDGGALAAILTPEADDAGVPIPLDPDAGASAVVISQTDAGAPRRPTLAAHTGGKKRTPPSPHATSKGVKLDEPVEAPPVGQAHLVVVAEPYGMVHVDGKVIGMTPQFDIAVSSGSHRVELIAPDTNTVRATRIAELSPGQTLRFDFR